MARSQPLHMNTYKSHCAIADFAIGREFARGMGGDLTAATTLGKGSAQA